MNGGEDIGELDRVGRREVSRGRDGSPHGLSKGGEMVMARVPPQLTVGGAPDWRVDSERMGVGEMRPKSGEKTGFLESETLI